MIRQHDSGRTHPDALGRRCDMRDQDLRRAARQPLEVVVLGDPEPLVAEAICRLRRPHRAFDRLPGGDPRWDVNEVEEGQRSSRCRRCEPCPVATHSIQVIQEHLYDAQAPGMLTVMPRKTALDRHRDSAPTTTPGSESGSELVDVLIAFHHPTRRWLLEVLGVEGPATVGMLADRPGLAVGSISHHLKALTPTRLHRASPGTGARHPGELVAGQLAPADLECRRFRSGQRRSADRGVGRGRELQAPAASHPAMGGRRTCRRPVARAGEFDRHTSAGPPSASSLPISASAWTTCSRRGPTSVPSTVTSIRTPSGGWFA